MEIDFTNIYKLKDYSFKNFVILSDAEIDSVWEWRNDIRIRRYFYNTDIIPYENHVAFVSELHKRKDVSYWLVFRKERPIGVMDMVNIDWVRNTATLGFYIAPKYLSKGISLDFVYMTYLFPFTLLDCDILYGGIHPDNINSLLLNEYLGCIMGPLISINEKDAQQYVKTTMTKDDFLNSSLEKNSSKVFGEFMQQNNNSIK